MTPCTFYRRAALISLMASLLGACSSTGGLDMIAADLPASTTATEQSSTADATTAEAPAKKQVVASGSGASDHPNESAPAPAVQAAAAAAAEGEAVASADASGEGQQQVVDVAVTSALPTQRPGQSDAAAATPVNAFAEQKKPESLAAATAIVEPVPSGQRVAPNSPELHALISRYAAHYNVPERLVHRVVKRESNYDPTARNRIYWGLMQIRHDTARTMGYRGSPEGLLDAETNLKYAVKYLRGAWLTAEGNEDQAVRFYSRGYYYDAKRKGLLQVTGLRP